eukprot:4906134-Amphidinium_carterae.1
MASGGILGSGDLDLQYAKHLQGIPSPGIAKNEGRESDGTGNNSAIPWRFSSDTEPFDGPIGSSNTMVGRM